MSNYHRQHIPGGCYFFTVVTWQRKPVFTSNTRVQILREALRTVKNSRPFQIDAMVVLPDHLHCIWQLPEGDADYSSRWREIKKTVSRQIDTPANTRRERLLWQRRFWEHAIRDDHDWRQHLDYIHFNPVKHGLVRHPSEWPWSTYHTALKKGWYDSGWGQQQPTTINRMDIE